MPASQTRPPIYKLPYDILRDIFFICLHQCPLRAQQPDTGIAPMVLCHVCSSWRTIALSSPLLWVHLSCCLDVRTIGSQLAFAKNQIGFLRWWRRNHDSVLPSLSLQVNSKRKRDADTDGGFVVSAGETGFLLNYLASARYLDVDMFYWRLIETWIGRTGQVNAVFPDLETVICPAGWQYTLTGIPDFHPAFTDLSSKNSPSPLRRLHISDTVFPYATIPSHWSRLTHISLFKVVLHLAFWRAFLNAVPQLAHGAFSIIDIPDFEWSLHRKYSVRTHPLLISLSVTLLDNDDEALEFPLSLLFAGLCLPALRSLSLSSCAQSWIDGRALDELHAVLESAPNITSLVLGNNFLTLRLFDYWVTQLSVNVRPIWSRTTHLVHLTLEIPQLSSRRIQAGSTSPNIPKIIPRAKAEHDLARFLQNAFLPETSRRWLALAHPACPIRSLTIVCDHELGLRQIEEFVRARTEELEERAPGVVFEIIEGSMTGAGLGAWEEWAHLMGRDGFEFQT